MIFRLNSVEELSTEVIKRMINKVKQYDIPRLNKLGDYYMDKNQVLKRVQEDKSKPNNKIAHPYARYITDTFTGYFLGDAVSYTSNENIEAYKSILDYNDEQQENIELGKLASIFGKAWELLYIDSDGDIRFTAIDPREVIPVYGLKQDSELVAAIRFYERYDVVKDNTYLMIDVYDTEKVVHYQTSTSVGSFEFLDEVRHPFNSVPFVLYDNNKEELGDYEEVIGLIDAYDALVSDGLNDFDYFCDAYLALYGYTADSDDVAAMKKNRVLLLDQGTSAEFLIKQGDSTGLETTKERIEKDIHKFAMVPNSSDENFGGNASGVAMKYKMLGTENVAAIKEQYFRKGLVSRAEKIGYVMALLRLSSFDWRGIEVIFTRNIPVNEDEVTSMITSLNGIVSKETLLSQLPFVHDAKAELEALNKESANQIRSLAGFTTIKQEKEEE